MYGVSWITRKGWTGLTGQRDSTGQDKGRMGVSMVSGDGLGAPPVDL